MSCYQVLTSYLRRMLRQLQQRTDKPTVCSNLYYSSMLDPNAHAAIVPFGALLLVLIRGLMVQETSKM